MTTASSSGRVPPGEGLADEVRRALHSEGFVESTEKGVPGFHVWTSRSTVGLVYVEVRLHGDRFNYTSTHRWGQSQIDKYATALTDAGFIVQRQDRVPVPRLAVARPARYIVRDDGHASFGVWDTYLVRFEALGLSESDAEQLAQELNNEAHEGGSQHG